MTVNLNLNQDMKHYNTTQERIISHINQMKEGEVLHIATSEYSINRIESTGWNPRFRAAHQTINALIKKGYGFDKFWRGCEFIK